MSNHLWSAFIVILGLQRTLQAVEIPLHPSEARIVSQIIAVEGHAVEAAEVPGWATKALLTRLREWAIDTSTLKSWGLRGTENKGLRFNCIYDTSGHVFAILGNGPWLRDDSLRALKGMPELRLIRIDHNGFVRNHPLSGLYSGQGFDALADSKLLEIRLTLGMTDAGMQQAAGIRGLRSFVGLHSQITDAGVKFFEGHPSLEAFSISEMGTVSELALASIAKMPKVEHIGFHEAFVTYERGFRHLASLRGRLRTLDLSMSLVNGADLDRVRADHPDAMFTTLSPAEIVKRHKFVAGRIARVATGEAAEELKRAIAESEAAGNPLK